jgi:hypothetical protein
MTGAQEELEATFWEKVDHDSRNISRCWPWRDAVQRGYGKFNLIDVNGKVWQVRPHRLAYILHWGEIPTFRESGIEVDHMCHDPEVCQLANDCPHRRCCNPHHMRLSTRAENTARGRVANKNLLKTHCARGHPYTVENTERRPLGRACATCHRLNSSTYYHTYKSAAVTGCKPNSQSVKMNCPRGHPYDQVNTMFNSRGHRKCRECSRLRYRERVAARSTDND